ncbi:uncharacterized protein LOC122498955 isoform X2 [Leptopilina heterotoma]|uniref:uncharacterized protein LOC122498955 isoform X2 n=1 Tax=Leptopilina heterotoma TaxID=63436 RepID=UPI001CA7E9FF|nr:uncharacterized protein LOC122498955 isoform X2 [Leptopilina heterotoma]
MKLGTHFKPGKWSRLCSDHFEETCFSKDTNRSLIPKSVPTKFGSYKSCCIFCHAIKGATKGRSFRKFPFDNAELLQKWLSALDVKDVVVTKKSLLCSDHFEAKCFRKTGKNASVLTLKSDAVPSLIARSEDVERHNIPKNLNENDILHKKREASPDNLQISKLVRSENVVNTVFLVSERDETLNKIQKQLSSNSTLLPKNSEALSVPSFLIEDNGCNINSLLPSSASGAKPQETATPGTPIAERCRRIYKDHHYETTPRSLRKKLKKNQTIISTLRNDSRIQKQKIIRLEKRITSLTHLVREIRKERLVPQSGLQCLETIAENDVFATIFTRGEIYGHSN